MLIALKLVKKVKGFIGFGTSFDCFQVAVKVEVVKRGEGFIGIGTSFDSFQVAVKVVVVRQWLNIWAIDGNMWGKTDFTKFTFIPTALDLILLLSLRFNRKNRLINNIISHLAKNKK